VENLVLHEPGTRKFVRVFLTVNKFDWSPEDARNALFKIDKSRIEPYNKHALAVGHVVFWCQLLNVTDVLGVPPQEGTPLVRRVQAP
jgi:hypothetical protein